MTDHRGYHIQPAGRNTVRAVCTCGWQSDRQPSGGLAGAIWDRHKETSQ